MLAMLAMLAMMCQLKRCRLTHLRQQAGSYGAVFQRSRYGMSTFTAPVGQSFSQGMQYQHSSNAM